MSKIALLEQNVINKIAAGEVVERPSSVIKELVENSIDAGSTNITIEIKQGGTSFIRITDNGSGVEQDDVLLAFERHATSKIRNAEDIENILSLGFRGEALASIAAVSQLEFITKTRSSLTGKLVQIHGGQVIKNEEIGCPEGTTIFVRNLFFNVPARMKFLKSASSEASHVSELITKLALGNPKISFKFINNNTTILQTNGNGNLKDCIFQVYGKEYVRKMIPIKQSGDLFEIEGYIGKPELSRNNKNHQSFFINGRYIKSNLLSKAVQDGYNNVLMVHKFPVVILHLKMTPTLMDVNVHPNKTEVRFENEEEIYDEIVSTIKKALKKDVLIPEVTLPKSKEQKETNFIQEQIIPSTVPNVISPSKTKLLEENPPNPKEDFSFPVKNINPTEHVEEKKEQYTSSLKEEEPLLQKEKLPHKETNTLNEIFEDIRYIGQLFSTYLIVEKDNTMYMIDQHAAHEKVMYEKYLQEFKNASVSVQQLLSPLVIQITYGEKKFIEKNEKLFKHLGFDLEVFGNNDYIIRGVPVLFGEPVDHSFFLELLDELMNKKVENLYDLKLDDIATVSCKSAVKAMDKLSPQEVKNLVHQLFALENPYHCPHGRPTIVSLSKYEIEKMFKRIQS